MVREYEVRRFADVQIAVDTHAAPAQVLDLAEQCDGIDHNAVTDHADRPWARSGCVDRQRQCLRRCLVGAE